jgi:hypothetical protein
MPYVTPHIKNYLYGPAPHVEWSCIRITPLLNLGPHFMYKPMFYHKGWRPRQLTTIHSRCPAPALGTPHHRHMLQGLMLWIPSVTPCVQKLLIWPSSARGMGLHTCSTSLTLSSLLRVKGLTWKCYVWNNKNYKLTLTPPKFWRWY